MSELSFERAADEVPRQHIRNAIASSVASKSVSREGTAFVESRPKERPAELALDHISKEKEIVILKEMPRNANMQETLETTCC